MDYRPLLIAISKDGYNCYSDDIEYEEPFDTKESFGLWIKHIPFSLSPKVKNIVSQTWKDEDGDDVFIPDIIKHESYEMDVKFVYLWNDGLANERINAFIKTIRGHWLRMYDSYTRIGRQGLFFLSCDEDPTFKRRANDIVIFSLKFKVNDPDTDVTL